MFDFSKYDYLIFDCDGVILNSNKLKSQAFADAMPDEPTYLIQDFVEYHQKNGGISRYEKFNYYFRELKKSSDVEEETLAALERFAAIVKKGLIECNYIPGVLGFLKRANSEGIPMFVVSGSDEKELKEVFRQRGTLNIFVQVFGSPVNKNNNTGKVIERIGAQKKGCFFGDSRSDYDASLKYGLDFVLVKGFSEWKDININIAESFQSVIKDFSEFNK